MGAQDIYQGIWIDRHKAFVFTFNEDKVDIQRLDSEIDTRSRIEGESNSSSRFGDQHLDQDKKKDLKLKGQTDIFLKKVSKLMDDSAEIVLFGPADTKHKLYKQSNAANVLSVETADSMTENQMAAWIRDFFDK